MISDKKKAAQKELDCDEIIYADVLPSIAKAFCQFVSEINECQLVPIEETISKEMIEEKARNIKSVINNFIDGQAATWRSLF